MFVTDNHFHSRLILAGKARSPPSFEFLKTLILEGDIGYLTVSLPLILNIGELLIGSFCPPQTKPIYLTSTTGDFAVSPYDELKIINMFVNEQEH